MVLRKGLRYGYKYSRGIDTPGVLSTRARYRRPLVRTPFDAVAWKDRHTSRKPCQRYGYLPELTGGCILTFPADGILALT